MSQPDDTGQEPGSYEMFAAQQDAKLRQERRNRWLIGGSAIGVVVIIVVSFVLVKANSNTKKTPPRAAAVPTSSAGTKTSASPSPSAVPTASLGGTLSSVVSTLTSVPTSVTDAVGDGGGQVLGKPQTIPGSPLIANGKPEVLYMGAEFCPYCGAERWAMIVALSRFGTFTNLNPISSAAEDGQGNAEPYPDTPTWTFYKSTFTSNYLTFTPVETLTNIPDPSNGSYTTLQTPTSAQQALISKWDAPPYVPSDESGSIPFIDFGNKYMIVGASYTPQNLANMTWAQIADALSHPSTTVAKGIDGTANYITAALCKLTNEQPAAVCTSTVQGLQSQI